MMKSVVLFALLNLVALATAGPVPEQATDEEREDWDSVPEREEPSFDKEERGVEFFTNGTVKNSTKMEEDKIRRLMQQGGQEQWRKTNEHWGEEREREEQDERSRRSPVDEDQYSLDLTDADSDSVPYCALAKLGNGCTATFIGPNYALTAGRCVYDVDRWQWREELGLYRGQSCNNSGVYMDVEQIWSTTGYTQQGWEEYDYALIKTPDSQRSPCWSAFGYRNSWTNQEFDLIGYPTIEVDKNENDAQTVCNYNSLFTTTCTFSEVPYSDLSLVYQCNTWGATGAPLLSGVPEEYDGFQQYTVVYGVNAYTNMDWNSGTMLDQQRFYQIVEWMRESGYDPLS